MSYFNAGTYTANATRLNRYSKGTAILNFIFVNGKATKYECVTNVLGKIGTKQSLRGYYCAAFRGWMENGVLEYTGYNYSLTEHGIELLKLANIRV